MKPIDDKQETVTIRTVSHDEEGKKRVEKTELSTHNIDTIRYVEKKLINKGVQRQDRHPADGIGISRPPPKSGHGGKFTWEGPATVENSELMAAPAAMDEGDPNYVDWEENGEEASELVVGEVEVSKVAQEHDGLARVDVDPRLQVN
ncbi:hypothetical protein AAZX31_19G175500 [Glycine max]|uniref:Uncharacterized protein n=2 Tax=Glycine subgen. Soja TaxID=1462606 RepID=I1NAI0_SOYBN|nr:uncharacterized protein LOC100808941 [Glycine max]XP_028215858.1 uncharacterized protein LOC114397965 [Glycine soja]KAG4913482.1 hypothetical protein JHK86_053915 [Glycine max]KAG4916417.1 hypothetical protein JHK87_053974 [Glycine soja]KAH1078571.1 hypothetical protein GYH30_053539 [Glycine max]KAH1195325.1 hypothetical protein GmHk_19G055875 [Glycine max]KHN02267.1 hypothetical protein glysoja_002291 [Glycine soja]|eukprot:XP_003553580.1 uncharacterized protein LOC100808941 [Glycine max]